MKCSVLLTHRKVVKSMLLTVVICSIILYTVKGIQNFSAILIGGGLQDDNTEIWNKIIELSGGKGYAKIGVVSAASSDPCCDADSSYAYYSAMLKLYGAADTYYIPISIDTKAMNVDPTVISTIKTMTGFMFGGGDQIRIIESYFNGDNYNIESPALQAIYDTLQSTGGVVAGTSAGTDCQTIRTMITGGYSYYGLDRGVKFYDNPEDVPSSGNDVTAYTPGGIGFFTYGFLDTHYANRGRQGRTMALLMDSSTLSTTSKHSFGIDENTALLVTSNGDNILGTVIGERSVFVLDATYATGSLSVDSPGIRNGRSIQNMRATRLTHDDSINLETMVITYASYKSSLSMKSITSDSLYHSTDIFESDATFEFDKVVDSLLLSDESSSYGLTKEKTPRYIITMNKSSIGNTVTVMAGTDPDTKEYLISYDGLWISVDVYTKI